MKTPPPPHGLAVTPASRIFVSKSWRFALLMLGAALFLPCPSAWAIGLSETPSAVQVAIKSQIGDGKLGGIDRTNEAGETTFDVSYTAKSGEEQGFTVADDGTVLSVEVKLADTPPPVEAAIRRLSAGWQIDVVNQNLADTDISYEADVSKDGQAKSITVGIGGELQDMDVTLAETPAVVQSVITNQVADGRIESIDEDFDPDGKSFDVEVIAKDGSRQGFSVSPGGTLLSREVSLDRIPPAVRKTIQDRLGGGKIIRVDRSLFEKVNGVLPFEVEGRKDDHPFNFEVGPRGRFLGMEE